MSSCGRGDQIISLPSLNYNPYVPEIFKTLRRAAIVESPNFFHVERSLINNSLPDRALTVPEFKAFILQCRRVGGWKKVSWGAENDLLRKAGIKTIARRRAALEGLKRKHFISELPRKNNKRMFLVNCVPLYNRATGEFLPSPSKRDIASLKAENTGGYVQIPNQLVDDGMLRHLSGRQLKVLLKIYEHNRLSLYGGCDPNVIRYLRHNRHLAIRGHVIEELYLTESEFRKSLQLLLNQGLLKLESRHALRQDHGRILVTPHEDCGTDQVCIIRPTYQILHHINAWRERGFSEND